MGRTIVIGDIHGCYDELVELLDLVGLRPDDLLIAAGDLVDRGPSPGAVVRLFRERPNSSAVAGNHERKHVLGIYSYAQEITRLQLGDDYAETVAWMRTLPYYVETDEVRVVHAAMVPGLPLAGQQQEILCGTTSGEKHLTRLFPGGYWHDHYTDTKPVVFGHHVTGDQPLIRSGRIFGLDTGACHGGYLTALCLPDVTIHAVAAHADHWAAVKRAWQLPVLQNRPWLELTWAELADTTARYGDRADDATRRWLAARAAWVAQLRALLPQLLAVAHRLAGTLTPEQMRVHPAKAWLFQARHGRLDLTAVARHCTTPQRTINLVDALGLPTTPPP